MLLEALIAILIFSMGILAIIGLQASSVRLAGDAKYRADANLLANRLIGSMWLAHSSPTFVADFSTGGAQYLAWNSSVAATLPVTGVSSPDVTIIQGAAASTVSSTVTINIYWAIPGQAGAGHKYSTRTQITN
jgi:type IV pilus assembly protein PilV